VAVIVVVLVSGGGVAYAKTRNNGPSYRTASVQTGSAVHALVSTGTIGPALQTTVTFPASGTVASVDVTVGQHVLAGAVLAALQTTTQSAAVTSARSSLASAQLTLYQAENGETSAQSGSGSGSSARSASIVTAEAVSASGHGASGSGSSSSGGSSAIVAAQRKLVASQQKIDAMLAQTKAVLALAGTLCTAPTATGTTSAGTGQSQPVTTPTPTPGGGKGPGGTGTTHPTPTTCSGALAQVLTDQTTTLSLEEGLSQQEAALNKILSHSTGSTSGSKSGSSAGSSGSGAASSSGTTTVVSASQLAADQAAVDAAQAELLVAQQDLAQATIVSPIAGTVVGVGLTVGQRAGTTSGIQIVGSTAHVVTTDVSVTNIATVKVGQSATVTPDGSATPIAGKVLEISVAPVSGTSTSYAVTIGLAGSPAGLHNGATAAVSIVTGQAAGAVVVPTSAVHNLGSFAFVTVLSGSTTAAVPVTVGVVGPQWTTVTATRTGSLPVGAEVVLADLSTPLPSSNTTTVRTGVGLGGGAGRFAGGAGFAGGGGGRAPTG
jgi:HlyD family secretion protein